MRIDRDSAYGSVTINVVSGRFCLFPENVGNVFQVSMIIIQYFPLILVILSSFIVSSKLHEFSSELTILYDQICIVRCSRSLIKILLCVF